MDDVENAKCIENAEHIERAVLETAGYLSEQELRSRNIRDKYYELADRIGSQDIRNDNEVEESFANVLDELELALRIAYLAVLDTPESHPNRALHLHNLGNKLYELFLRSKSLSDLEEAIRIGQAAVDATPKDGASRPEYLACLGARLFARYCRTESNVDFERSMRLAQAFVDASGEHHPRRAMYLQNLGVGFNALFLRTGSMDHLGKAIRIGQAAVDAAEDSMDHLDRVLCLDGLGASFYVRYRQTGSSDDLDNAIRAAQAAISITSEDDPGRAKRLNGLATAFWARYHRTGSTDDLQEAFTHLTDSLYDAGSPHFDCLVSGISAASIASQWGQYDQGAQYLAECLELLPFSVTRTQSHEDLQYVLRQLSGLAALSACVFIRAGRSTLESLQALEKSRGIISSFVTDSKFDASILEERHPDIATQFSYVHEFIAKVRLLPLGSINAAFPQAPEGIYPMFTIARNMVIKELDVVKALIQHQPGFEKFQQPPTEAELHGMARYGPIVSFNVSPFGSHAFLITQHNLQALPLPKLVLQDVQEQVSRDMGGNLSRRDAKLVSIDGSTKVEGSLHASTQKEGMRWIWDVAVKPVLEELGLLWQHKPPPVLPCLWWVGGGLMALLPLHAAGDHQLGSTENTMSHVVSSYAPSLKVLQFSQKKAWTPPKNEATKILVITMPKTQGHADLNVEDEVAAIRNHVGSSALVEVLETPTPETVLEKTPACSLIHFACHGASDVERPSDSALLLGTKSIEKLTIDDLRSLDHRLAQVAYLSACSTAEIGARSLVDESINLATTFQLAGFRHVIGTLWGAFDSAAAAVAAKFYEHLLKQDADTVSPVARALHHAVWDLRAKNGNSESISLWAPFIHIGP